MGLGIETVGITRRFGGKAALEGFSCSFRPGGISAVIGPNGGGKTTLLRILAGLEPADSGSVIYARDGRPVAHGPELMRSITLAAQRPTLFRMSLRRNIEYGLMARGLHKDEVRARAEKALAEGGLSHLASASGLTLSGGEAQRAALVRAFALVPEAVLLDEPTASLDPENTALAEGLIRSLNREHGTTVVLVTHNLFQARRLAGRIYLVMGGRLIEHGTPEEIFTRPASPLTSGYISGEMVY